MFVLSKKIISIKVVRIPYYKKFLQRRLTRMLDMENDGETESDTELGLPLFRPFTRFSDLEYS